MHIGRSLLGLMCLSLASLAGCSGDSSTSFNTPSGGAAGVGGVIEPVQPIDAQGGGGQAGAAGKGGAAGKAGQGGGAQGGGGQGGAAEPTACVGTWTDIPPLSSVAPGVKILGVRVHNQRAVALITLPDQKVVDVAVYDEASGWKVSPSEGNELQLSGAGSYDLFEVVDQEVTVWRPHVGSKGPEPVTRSLAGGAWTVRPFLPPTTSRDGFARLGGYAVSLGGSKTTQDGNKLICNSVDESTLWDALTGALVVGGSKGPLGPFEFPRWAPVSSSSLFVGLARRNTNVNCTNSSPASPYRPEGAILNADGSWGPLLAIPAKEIGTPDLEVASLIGLDGAVGILLPVNKDNGAGDAAYVALYAKPTDTAWTVRTAPPHIESTFTFYHYFWKTMGGVGTRVVSVYNDKPFAGKPGRAERAVWDLESNEAQPLCEPPAPFEAEDTLENGPWGQGVIFLRDDLSGGIVALP